METEKGHDKYREQDGEHCKEEADRELGNGLLEDLGASLCNVSVRVALADALVFKNQV